MEKPTKLKDFNGSTVEHTDYCIDYTVKTGNNIPLDVYKSMSKRNRMAYLKEVYKADQNK